MSLARAFTTISKRVKKPEDDSVDQLSRVGRAASQRAGRPVLRTNISSPLALVSTSNTQLHHAKDILGTNPIAIYQIGNEPAPTTSSNASVSGADSDSDNMGFSTGHQTDASSVDDESPLRAEPEPNHLSCYFKPAVDTSTVNRSRSSTATSSTPSLTHSASAPSSPIDGDTTTPRIPVRVPSHSKKAHERLHRTRSMQRMISSPHTSLSSTASRRSLLRSASTASMGSNPYLPKASLEASPSFTGEGGVLELGSSSALATPFGLEIAQLDVVAEEFASGSSCGGLAGGFDGGLDAEQEAERSWLLNKGFAVCGAEEYLAEVAGLNFWEMGVVGGLGRGVVVGGGVDGEAGWF